MGVVLISFLLVASAWGEEVARNNHVVGASDVNEDISSTELKLVFTVRQDFQLIITPALFVPGLNYLQITHASY